MPEQQGRGRERTPKKQTHTLDNDESTGPLCCSFGDLLWFAQAADSRDFTGGVADVPHVTEAQRYEEIARTRSGFIDEALEGLVGAS